jgi:hypothetical protein
MTVDIYDHLNVGLLSYLSFFYVVGRSLFGGRWVKLGHTAELCRDECNTMIVFHFAHSDYELVVASQEAGVVALNSL